MSFRTAFRSVITSTALIATVAIFLSGCSFNSTPVPVTELKSQGKVDVSARVEKNEGEKGFLVSITTTCLQDPPCAMVIPAGTILAGGDSSTQRLVTAKPLVIAASSSETTTSQVPALCLDEFKSEPVNQTNLYLVGGEDSSSGDGSVPIQKLMDCLSASNLPLETMQVAVWCNTEKIFLMSQSDAVNTLTQRFADKIRQEQQERLETRRDQFRLQGITNGDIDQMIQHELNREDISGEARMRAAKQIDIFRQSESVIVGCDCAKQSDLIFN